MKKFFKLARIGFYILTLLFFFIVGLYYAGWIEAGKGQGLAGGAIVIGYGAVFAAVALTASFCIAWFLSIKTIKIINWVLIIFIAGSYGYTHYQFKKRKADQKEKDTPYQKNKTPTEPVDVENQPTAMLFKNELLKAEDKEKTILELDDLGIGFFQPNFHEHSSLLFYGKVTPGKSLSENVPQDSLVLHKDEYGIFNLKYAPPYVLPEFMNSDHAIFHFKVISISGEMVEVEVNKKTRQKSYFNKQQGTYFSWPEYLLKANTVSFKNNHPQSPKIKPLENAANITQEFVEMRPLAANNEWLEVSLIDKTRSHIGSGWIQWNWNGKLIIDYLLPNQ